MQDKNNELYERLSKEMNEQEFAKAYLNPFPEPKNLGIVPGPENMIFIIAGNVYQARRFAEEYGIAPPYWRYISCVDDLTFIKGWVVTTGTFYQRHDVDQLQKIVISREELKVLDVK